MSTERIAPSSAWVMRAAAVVLNEWGYLVIATSEPDEYQIGQTVTEVWSVEIAHPFRIVEKSSCDEYFRQIPLVRQHMIAISSTDCNDPFYRNAGFWRAVTD